MDRIMDEKFLRESAKNILKSALKAVDPYNLVFEQIKRKKNKLTFQSGYELDLGKFNNVYLLGIGKGVAPMARAVSKVLDEKLISGDIIVKYEHGESVDKTTVHEAGHPIPDENTLIATSIVLNKLKNLSDTDLVFVLLTGGGSALFEKLPDSVNLTDLQVLNELLLGCGATIHEINCVRKHISYIKGGQLSRLIYPAKVVTLALSDVVGDDLSVIASGPTTPDESTFAEAVSIIKKYKIENKIPQNIAQVLDDGVEGKTAETPKNNDAIFNSVTNMVIGSNIVSLRAAEEKAKKLGFNTLVLTSMIQGDVKELAKVMEALIREIQQSNIPVQKPACLLIGGEPTLKVTGKGKGGRNQEFALTVLDKGIEKPYLFLSCGTDGTDGPTNAAGAMVTHATLQKADLLDLNTKEYLANNDAYNFFSPLRDLIKTGPTRTNVMDIMITLVP
jgi:glycerate 2-kinase